MANYMCEECGNYSETLWSGLCINCTQEKDFVPYVRVFSEHVQRIDEK